jgi:hypothetical protein
MQDKIHFDLGLITKNKLFPDHKTKERERNGHRIVPGQQKNISSD